MLIFGHREKQQIINIRLYVVSADAGGGEVSVYICDTGPVDYSLFYTNIQFA
jgi:hypothetical protein